MTIVEHNIQLYILDINITPKVLRTTLDTFYVPSTRARRVSDINCIPLKVELPTLGRFSDADADAVCNIRVFLTLIASRDSNHRRNSHIPRNAEDCVVE